MIYFCNELNSYKENLSDPLQEIDFKIPNPDKFIFILIGIVGFFVFNFILILLEEFSINKFDTFFDKGEITNKTPDIIKTFFRKIRSHKTSVRSFWCILTIVIDLFLFYLIRNKLDFPIYIMVLFCLIFFILHLDIIYFIITYGKINPIFVLTIILNCFIIHEDYQDKKIIIIPCVIVVFFLMLFAWYKFYKLLCKNYINLEIKKKKIEKNNPDSNMLNKSII